MAPNQEQLMVAAVVIGIVGLVVYNQSTTEQVLDQPPDLDTKTEATMRFKARTDATQEILATKEQMTGWAVKTESFLEETGGPRGRDRSDVDWIEMQAMLKAGNTLYERLRDQLLDWNRMHGKGSFDQVEDVDDEQPREFKTQIEELDHKYERWSAYFREVDGKRDEVATE